MKKFTFKKNYAEKLFLNIFFVGIFKVNDEYSTKMSWILNAVRNVKITVSRGKKYGSDLLF
jgi:hypothetical protein